MPGPLRFLPRPLQAAGTSAAPAHGASKDGRPFASKNSCVDKTVKEEHAAGRLSPATASCLGKLSAQEAHPKDAVGGPFPSRSSGLATTLKQEHAAPEKEPSIDTIKNVAAKVGGDASADALGSPSPPEGPGLALPGAFGVLTTTTSGGGGNVCAPPAPTSGSSPKNAPAGDAKVLPLYHRVPPKLKKYFLSEEEKDSAVPFKQHCQSIQLLDKTIAPGSLLELESASTSCLEILRGAASLFGEMHKKAKKSFKGKFSIHDLYVTETGRVKFGGNLNLSTKTTSRANRDWNTLARELRRDVFHEGEPLEITVWLNLMASESAAARELTKRCHSSLMSPWNKISLFNWMHKRLWVLERKDVKKFKLIIGGLPYAHNWKHLAKSNSYLYEVYYSEDEHGNRKSFYAEDIKGLLRFIRNALEHLHEKSCENGQQMFQEWEVASIVSSTFPLLIGYLQAMMELEGQLDAAIVEPIMG